MSLLTLLAAIVILGLICWALYQFPIPHPVRVVIIVVVCIAVIIWLLGGMPLRIG